MTLSPELLASAVAGGLIFLILATPVAIVAAAVRPLFGGFALKVVAAVVLGVLASFAVQSGDLASLDSLRSLGEFAQKKLTFITDIARDLATNR